MTQTIYIIIWLIKIFLVDRLNQLLFAFIVGTFLTITFNHKFVMVRVWSFCLTFLLQINIIFSLIKHITFFVIIFIDYWRIILFLIRDPNCLYYYLKNEISSCKPRALFIIQFNHYNIVDHYFYSQFYYSNSVIILFDHYVTDKIIFALINQIVFSYSYLLIIEG